MGERGIWFATVPTSPHCLHNPGGQGPRATAAVCERLVLSLLTEGPSWFIFRNQEQKNGSQTNKAHKEHRRACVSLRAQSTWSQPAATSLSQAPPCVVSGSHPGEWCFSRAVCWVVLFPLLFLFVIVVLIFIFYNPNLLAKPSRTLQHTMEVMKERVFLSYFFCPQFLFQPTFS